MKSSVAIVLIICGTVLIIVPYIHNTLLMQQVTGTMAALGRDVDLRANMPEYADAVCIVGGAVMIAVGAVAGLCRRKLD